MITLSTFKEFFPSSWLVSFGFHYPNTLSREDAGEESKCTGFVVGNDGCYEAGTEVHILGICGGKMQYAGTMMRDIPAASSVVRARLSELPIGGQGVTGDISTGFAVSESSLLVHLEILSYLMSIKSSCLIEARVSVYRLQLGNENDTCHPFKIVL